MATKRTASLAPSQTQIVSGQVVNADLATSAEFVIPNDAEEISIYVDATNTAGATPTLVAALQTTPSGPQAASPKWFYTGNSVLHSATGLMELKFSRQRHAGQAAETFAGDPPAVGAASAARNGSIARRCRLLFRISAGASWTVNAWLEASPSA